MASHVGWKYYVQSPGRPIPLSVPVQIIHISVRNLQGTTKTKYPTFVGQAQASDFDNRVKQ